MNVETTDTRCFNARSAEGESELWYKRLGHLNFISLGHLSSKKVAPEKSCDICITGKKPRLSFSSEMPPRATHALGVVHSDVCGTFKVPSLREKKYFVSFVDEFIRMTWVAFIKFKYEMVVEFKKFKVKAKNQSGQRLKILRTGGGGEFNSIEFKKFCEEHGIEHEVVAPYTSQHNGLAERRNRIMLDMIKNILKEKNLPHTLWGELISTSAYVLNRCPTKKLKEVVLIEKCAGRKQSVSHFKVFGYVCYKHIPDATRKKLDDRRRVMLLIGYHS